MRHDFRSLWTSAWERHRSRPAAMPRYEALAVGLGCDSLGFRAARSPEWR